MKRILTTLSQKWPEYLLEMIVITAGILGAFALNNWNEDRKLGIQRQELISSLIEDFEYNYQTLQNEKIVTSESRLASMDLFYKFIWNNDQIVAMDSLRDLAIVFFRFNTFNPNLTAYHNAESTGSLGLLQDKKLLQQFTLFIESHETLQMITQRASYAFFAGSSWEFRKQLEPGSIYKSRYSGSTASDIPFKEYQSLMSNPLAQNALQNGYILEGNSLDQLKELSDYSLKILEILRGMQNS